MRSVIDEMPVTAKVCYNEIFQETVFNFDKIYFSTDLLTCQIILLQKTPS